MKIIIILNAIGCGIINYTESNRFSKYSECRDVNEAIHYKTVAETEAFVSKAKAVWITQQMFHALNLMIQANPAK